MGESPGLPKGDLCKSYSVLLVRSTRTLVDIAFDGTIRVRRYLCRCCKRTVPLLLEFALPYLRFGIVVIALFLVARLLLGLTLKAAAASAN